MQLLRLFRVMHAQMTSTESNMLMQVMLYACNIQDRISWRARVCVCVCVCEREMAATMQSSNYAQDQCEGCCV